MAYCRDCGAALPEGTKFCPACGASTESTPVRAAAEPQLEYPAEKPKKKRRSLFRRWWFWLLILVLAANLAGRTDLGRALRSVERAAEPIVTAPRATAEPTPEAKGAAAESEIRPEVKTFLDSYEAFMDEYVDFMHRYGSADPNDMAAMMGDYTSILARYTEFAAKIDAMDESELTAAELAYYLEVTGRVSQKLLGVA